MSPRCFFPESFSERVLRSVRPGVHVRIRPAARTAESIVKMRHFVVSPSPLSANLRKLRPQVRPSRRFVASKRSRAMFFGLFRDSIVRIAYFCDIFAPEPSRPDFRSRSPNEPEFDPKTEPKTIPKRNISAKYPNEMP